jgi:hypothetical protein
VATILSLESSRNNAIAESLFSSLKKERIKKQIYKNRELAIADVPTTSISSTIERLVPGRLVDALRSFCVVCQRLIKRGPRRRSTTMTKNPDGVAIPSGVPIWHT